MAAQPGRDILIKVNTSGSTYTALAGLRTKSLKINSATIDVTNSDSAGRWRELLGGASVNSLQVSGAGVFVDDAAAGVTVQAAMSGQLKTYQIIIPSLGTFEGLFQVSDCTLSGDYNGEVTYSATFESAGAITFTAA